MALATFKLLKCTAAETEIDANNHPCFLSANVHTETPSTYPVAIPALPTDPDNYSFEIALRVEMTGAPDNQVQNLKVFGPDVRPDASQSPGNKLTIYMGTTDTFPGGGLVMTQSSIAATRQDTNYYSPGTALVIPIDEVDGIMNAVGEQSDYIFLQLEIVNAANIGDMETMTFSYQYEES